MASTASKQEKQQGASQVLDILRAEKRHEAKVRATVEGWIRDGLWSNMQLCLGEDPATFEHRRLLVEAYGISTKEGERNIPNILATLQKHVLQPAHLLQTGTLPSFMAICKSSHGEVKQALAAKVQEFVADTVKSMADTVEATEVYTALGLTPEGRIGEHNVDAVLPVLQKLLSVSEKLRAQTLAKVVASLHTYPTGGFPPALCRLAALRELRLRCEKTDGSPLDPQDLQRALSLIKPLLKQKLHTRTLGAGQGGGVFGFFGYTLNGTGKFIEYVVQTCQGGQPAPLVLHRAELRPLFEASAEPAYRDALMRVMNQPNGAAFNDATQFAECYALQYKPGALEKALKSRNPEAARHALATQLEIARLRAEATFKGVDTAGSVAALKAYFDLEVLATRHQLTTPPLALGIDDKLLQFYRAALTWPNKTALAKNIRAMQTELEQRMSGQTGAANPFWSAKFLQSQGPAIDNDEWRKMRRLHPEILAKSYTYKAQVQTLRAWNRMSAATLWQATQKKASKVGLWLQLQFKAWGLPPLNDATLEAAITQLKEAKTAHEWTVQLAKIKSEARNKHETDLITRMVRPPTPAVRRPIEGSNSSTNDTSNNGPHKWRSGVLVPQLMN